MVKIADNGRDAAMIKLTPLGQLTTPPSMVPFVDRLKFNYERTVKTLMKATPRSLDSMLRSANQILSNESALQTRARSVRELRNLPAGEQAAALRGYYEAIKRAVAVIKSGESGYSQQAQLPTTPQPPPAYAPETMPAPPVFQPPALPPAFTMPSLPDLTPPPRYVSPVEPPPRFEPPPEPPPFTMPTTPPRYVSPVEPVTRPPVFEPPQPPRFEPPPRPVAAIQLLPLPRKPYSEKFKQILSDAISAAFRSLNLTVQAQSPGMVLSPTRYSHVVNVTYEVANKVGRTIGHTYTKRLIQDALQWRYIKQSGIQTQLPGYGDPSPYALSAAVIAPVPITPPTPQPIISPEPSPPVTVPGLIPVGPPAQIMDARFLEILNRHMDYFLKSQRYTVRPTYVWYIPRHMMERFVKEIMDASNRDGNKYGYTYNKGLVWDALQQRGYEPSTKPDGTKRTPYDKTVQSSPYDKPGSQVPATGRQIIPPIVTPPAEIPDTPTPPAPTPEPERKKTYAEKVKRLQREAEERWAPILREREAARKIRDDLRRKERAEKKRLKALRPKRYLPIITPAQYARYQDMLNKAIDNRLQAAEWPTMPGAIISIPDTDYEKLIASVQTFANMIASTIKKPYHRFGSDEVGDALASRGYVRGDNTRPAHGPGAAPLSSRVINFNDYKELLEAIRRKLSEAKLPFLVMATDLSKPLKKHLVGPILESQACFDTMQRVIDQVLMVRRRWESRPLYEKILSPAAHAGLVHQVWQYANAQYGSGVCPFTVSYTRDALLKRGYLSHPEGTSTPSTPRHVGPGGARAEEKWRTRGQAIYPWEVYTHFPAHFQRNLSTQPIYPTPEPIYHPPGT